MGYGFRVEGLGVHRLATWTKTGTLVTDWRPPTRRMRCVCEGCPWSPVEAGANAEEVFQLRTQMEAMAMRQKEWEGAWKTGKEALLRVHAQELENQRVRRRPHLSAGFRFLHTSFGHTTGWVSRDGAYLSTVDLLHPWTPINPRP